MNIALEATLAKLPIGEIKASHTRACPGNGKEATRQAAEASD